ncbi:hypothetical protein EOY42_25885 [Salmonella enterica]|nr:hypothetical protein [Salmonella enterica]
MEQLSLLSNVAGKFAAGLCQFFPGFIQSALCRPARMVSLRYCCFIAVIRCLPNQGKGKSAYGLQTEKIKPENAVG